MTENVIHKFNLIKFGELLEEFYGKKLSATGLEVYAEAFKKYDVDQIKKAFIAHTKDPKRYKYFPKPQDIIEHIYVAKKKNHNGCYFEDCNENGAVACDNKRLVCWTHYEKIRPKSETDKLLEQTILKQGKFNNEESKNETRASIKNHSGAGK